MMSSNPEGLSQFGRSGAARPQSSQRLHVVDGKRRRPGEHREGIAYSDRDESCRNGTTMVRGRCRSLPPAPLAPAAWSMCDVMGYNYMDPQAEAYHKAHPEKPVIGTETVSAVGTRGIYVTDPKKGYVGSYDPYTTTGRASAEGWWSFCNARPWLLGRLRVDGLRLSRRALAEWLAQHQLAIRHHRHLRLSEGHVLLLPVLVDRPSRCCTSFRIGIGRGWRARRSRSGFTPIWTRWSCSSTARAWARKK